MAASFTVGKDKLLFCHIDEVYVVSVYDKTASEAEEIPAGLAKLVTYNILYLSKLQAE